MCAVVLGGRVSARLPGCQGPAPLRGGFGGGSTAPNARRDQRDAEPTGGRAASGGSEVKYSGANGFPEKW